MATKWEVEKPATTKQAWILKSGGGRRGLSECGGDRPWHSVMEVRAAFSDDQIDLARVTHGRKRLIGKAVAGLIYDEWSRWREATARQYRVRWRFLIKYECEISQAAVGMV